MKSERLNHLGQSKWHIGTLMHHFNVEINHFFCLLFFMSQKNC